MIVRPYANLAPERFRPAFGIVFRIVAICCVASIVLKYCTAIPAPWTEGVEGLFFFLMGLNYVVWPNDGTVPPLANRVIGGLLAGLFLCFLITYIRHHL